MVVIAPMPMVLRFSVNTPQNATMTPTAAIKAKSKRISIGFSATYPLILLRYYIVS